jgi:hypothetical protein
MAYKNRAEITGIHKTKVPFQTIYKYGVILWQAVRSCFGSGIWVNEKPWINEEIWKNE